METLGFQTRFAKILTFHLGFYSAPKRGFGKAELLVEASFTDMRHGGDGNLDQAYKFAKRVS